MGGMGGGDQAAAAEDKRAQVEDMKNGILSQVLTQEARARRKFGIEKEHFSLCLGTKTGHPN
jgi:hypothetical protein